MERAFGMACAKCLSSPNERDSKEKQMKLIIAYIQPERLNAVKQALFAREIYKMSATNALGCGQQGGYIHMYRGATEEVTLHKKMRLAIGVNDDRELALRAGYAVGYDSRKSNEP